jgi:hypothetical protein
MLWLQTLPPFAVWVAYAVIRRRWMRESRRRLAAVPRGVRIARMFAALFGSLAVLFAGMWCISALGWLDGGMTLAGFIAVTLVGLAFVHLQMAATVLTLSLATETREPGLTSNTRTECPPTSGDLP